MIYPIWTFLSWPQGTVADQPGAGEGTCPEYGVAIQLKDAVKTEKSLISSIFSSYRIIPNGILMIPTGIVG